jgi:hypothetical protein
MEIAKWYYQNRLGKFKGLIDWQTGDNEQQHSYAGHQLEYKATDEITIRFKLQDLTRLDIIEEPEMVKNICRCFIEKKDGRERTINWYDFNKKGVNRYRKKQAEAIRRTFAFEEGLKIDYKKWQTKKYVPFNKNPKYEKEGFETFILEEAEQQDKIKKADKEALNKVRKDYFHEKFLSSDEDRKVFGRCMPVVKNDEKYEDKKRKK